MTQELTLNTLLIIVSLLFIGATILFWLGCKAFNSWEN